MAVNRKDEFKNAIEYEREINALNDKLETVEQQKEGQITDLTTTITALEARVLALENKFSTAITDNTHFVCDTDTEYNETNSKTLTITDGLITGIEGI